MTPEQAHKHGIIVKPLGWKYVDAYAGWWTAPSIGGNYTITWTLGKSGKCLTYPGKNGMNKERFANDSDAKTAAQADHERRILELIE